MKTIDFANLYSGRNSGPIMIPVAEAGCPDSPQAFGHQLGRLILAGLDPKLREEYVGTESLVGGSWNNAINTSYESGELGEYMNDPHRSAAFLYLAPAFDPIITEYERLVRSDQGLTVLRPSEYALDNALAGLVVQGLDLGFHRWLDTRRQGVGLEGYKRGVISEDKAFYEGTLNEIEAAQALVLASKTYGWWVLPAPQLFDSSQKNPEMNCDLLVIDPSVDQAVGVQVKSRARDEDLNKYARPKEGIVIISGFEDLDNRASLPYDRNTGKAKEVSYAGLMTAALASYNPNGYAQAYLTNRGLSKAGAKTFALYINQITGAKPGSKSNLPRARGYLRNHVPRVEKRVQRALQVPKVL